MSHPLLLLVLSIVLIAIAVGGAWPVLHASASPGRVARLARIGDPFATGVFLGAGLVHLLPDAAQGFGKDVASGYPFAFLIAGIVMIGLGWIESSASAAAETASEKTRDRHGGRAMGPLVAAVALSIHSLLAGASLGVGETDAAILVTFLALVLHKGAASFALARLLSGGGLSRGAILATMAIFIAALPVGVLLGDVVAHVAGDTAWLVPAILALGAGTFLHFGTVHHHFDRDAGPLETRWPTAAGFALMALAAIFG